MPSLTSMARAFGIVDNGSDPVRHLLVWRRRQVCNATHLGGDIRIELAEPAANLWTNPGIVE